MAFTEHQASHAADKNPDDGRKINFEHISNNSRENIVASRVAREPPSLIKSLSADERRRLELALVRKIDLRLLPMVILMYIMNYLDRNNIAAARLAGLEDELNLTSSQYLTALSILFVGYILMQVPSNLFLNKIGLPAVYLPSVMIAWGVISGATAGVQSFGGLVAVRFCLGFVEAAYFPGCLLFLSSWYTRSELGFRTAILYSGSLLSGAFSGLISAGITNGLDGAKNIRAWRWLFIIEGAITVIIAVVAFFVLPNFPRTTIWLTENERQLAIWRLEEDIGEDDWNGQDEQSFFHGMKLAFQDVKMYILVLFRPSPFNSGIDNPADGDDLLFCRLGNCHQFISHHCQNFGLFQYHITSPHCTSVLPSSHHHLLECVACRPNGRTLFPRDFTSLFCSLCIYPRCSDNRYRTSLFGHDAYGARCVYGVCSRTCMDLKYSS